VATTATATSTTLYCFIRHHCGFLSLSLSLSLSTMGASKVDVVTISSWESSCHQSSRSKENDPYVSNSIPHLLCRIGCHILCADVDDPKRCTGNWQSHMSSNLPLVHTTHNTHISSLRSFLYTLSHTPTLVLYLLGVLVRVCKRETAQSTKNTKDLVCAIRRLGRPSGAVSTSHRLLEGQARTTSPTLLLRFD
jgi:hypothetical protein